jgi:hypothetical protein
VAGWTLPLQMGVGVDAITAPLATAELERVDTVTVTPGSIALVLSVTVPATTPVPAAVCAAAAPAARIRMQTPAAADRSQVITRLPVPK